ncbi:MAG: hypothetical protein FJ271_27325 [Planctomycetes bacterium]|nr:hypothetical protein [Planctomycetota bacterium]
MYQIDGNGNVILVSEELTRRKVDGHPLVVVRLAAEPDRGYIAQVLPGGAFGTDECPSSEGRPCLGWFGPGEASATAFDALAALASYHDASY